MPSISVPTAVAAGIGAAGSIGGAIISGNAASDAANTSAQAANNATGVQQQEFAQTTANNKPFLDTGTSAMDQLAGLYGVDTTDASGNTVPGGGTASAKIDPNATFYQSPDYQFQLSQGIKGVDAGAAARGELDSGATRKAEMSYAGNLASGQFNNYAQRLQSLAGIGQAAANNQAQAGQNFSTGYSNTVTNAANAQNNAGIAGANAYSSGLNSATGTIAQYLTKNQSPFSSSYASGGPITPSNSYDAYYGAGEYT